MQPLGLASLSPASRISNHRWELCTFKSPYCVIITSVQNDAQRKKNVKALNKQVKQARL